MEQLDNEALMSAIATFKTLPDRVTNLTLINKGDVRVAVIAIPEGNKLAPHKAPVDVLIIGLEGKAKVHLGKEEFEFHEHSALRFPANKMHGIEALSDFKMLLIK